LSFIWIVAPACLWAFGCAGLDLGGKALPQAPSALPAKAAVYIDSDLGLYYDEDKGVCTLPVGHRDALDRLGYPLARLKVFQKTEIVETRDPGDADFLVSLSVRNHRVKYVGRNRWWPVNIGVWFLVWIPSWWIPDETFSAEMDLEITVKDCLTSEEIYRKSLHADTTRNLNDLDRGWTPVAVFNDAFGEENFRKASRKLDVDLWETIHMGLYDAMVIEFPKAVEEARWKPRLTNRAVVLGIGDDACIADAQAVASFLTKKAGFDPENVLLLTGRRGEPVTHREGELDVDPFEKVWDAIREWKKIPFPERNRIFFYFAGEGALMKDGTPALVSSSGERGRIPITKVLAPLEELLSSTVVVDAGFRALGGVRSFPQAATGDGQAFFESLKQSRTALVLAVPPGQEGLLDPLTRRGVLTQVLLNAAGGAADTDENGNMTVEEIRAYVESQVSGFAGVMGRKLSPLILAPPDFWFPRALADGNLFPQDGASNGGEEEQREPVEERRSEGTDDGPGSEKGD